MLRLPLGSWDAAVCHVGHMCVLVVHWEGTKVLMDPFFTRRFWWEGHWERQLQPPAFEPEALDRLDMITVSHDHPDHNDMQAVESLIRRTGAKLLCPDIVKTAAMARQIREEDVISMKDWQVQKLGTFKITALPDKDSKGTPYPQRLCFLVEAGAFRLFHSGDSNGADQSLKGKAERLDLAMTHSFYTDEFLQTLMPRKLLLLDNGRFEPGRFMINADCEKLKTELQPRYPETEILIPPPNHWITLPQT